MPRSNPFPGSRLKRLRTPEDYARAQRLLDEIDGKLARNDLRALTADEVKQMFATKDAAKNQR